MEKIKLRPRTSPLRRDAVRLFLHSPRTRQTGQHFLWAAAGFFLAGGRFLGASLPWAVCLIAALGCTLPSLCVYLGAILGSFLLWQSEGMLFTVGAGFLTLVIAWALSETPFGEQPIFRPFTALAPGILVGALLLFSATVDARSILIFLLQVLLLPLGTLAAEQVLKDPAGPAVALAVFAFTSGCGSILLPGGVSLGAVLACGALLALCSSKVVYPTAALAGLALDWSWQGETSCIAALSAAALVASLLPEKGRLLRYSAFTLACGCVIVLTGGGGGTLFMAAILGGGLTFLLPTLPTVSDGSLRSRLSRRLTAASDAMEGVYRDLLDSPLEQKEVHGEDVFQDAMDRVCQICARKETCWVQDAEKTYAAIKAAEPAFLQRKQALREDFSPEFRGKCRLFSEFLCAINESLQRENYLLRQRQHRRELRTVMGNQYRITADFLRGCERCEEDGETPRFAPEFAVKQRCRKGSSVSGDAWESLFCGERFYLLLCDGMGSGKAAHMAAEKSIRLITALLASSMAADDALETFNCVSILREDGGASTVDLLEADLISGDCTLYKWGGSPSYLMHEGAVRKMGTASLPPGVGVGGTHMPQCFRLSLGRGEALILTSDGVGGEDALAAIRRGGNSSPEELAAGIVGCGYSEGEDDGTAVVLKLEPASAQ